MADAGLREIRKSKRATRLDWIEQGDLKLYQSFLIEVLQFSRFCLQPLRSKVSAPHRWSQCQSFRLFNSIRLNFGKP